VLAVQARYSSLYEVLAVKEYLTIIKIPLPPEISSTRSRPTLVNDSVWAIHHRAMGLVELPYGR
jgi:hypothetical protein